MSRIRNAAAAVTLAGATMGAGDVVGASGPNTEPVHTGSEAPVDIHVVFKSQVQIVPVEVLGEGAVGAAVGMAQGATEPGLHSIERRVVPENSAEMSVSGEPVDAVVDDTSWHLGAVDAVVYDVGPDVPFAEGYDLPIIPGITDPTNVETDEPSTVITGATDKKPDLNLDGVVDEHLVGPFDPTTLPDTGENDGALVGVGAAPAPPPAPGGGDSGAAAEEGSEGQIDTVDAEGNLTGIISEDPPSAGEGSGGPTPAP